MFAADYLRIFISQLELIGILMERDSRVMDASTAAPGGLQWAGIIIKRANVPHATWMHLGTWLKEMDLNLAIFLLKYPYVVEM